MSSVEEIKEILRERSEELEEIRRKLKILELLRQEEDYVLRLEICSNT